MPNTFSASIATGKDLLALARDELIFFLVLLLLFFPAALKNRLVEAGIREGEFMGLKWNAKDVIKTYSAHVCKAYANMFVAMCRWHTVALLVNFIVRPFFMQRSTFSAIGFLLLTSATAMAQAVKLPPDHSIQQSTSGASNLLRTDLDGDGKSDIFCVAENGGGDGYFVAITSTRGRMESSAVPACCGSVEKGSKPGVVRVASKGMRGFSYYTFRWDAAAKDFRLIGYDTESFGNAMNDGSGKSSLNLLTGNFEAAFNSYSEKKSELVALPKVRKKLAVSRRIYLQNFGEDNEAWIADLAYRNFPKEVQ